MVMASILWVFNAEMVVSIALAKSEKTIPDKIIVLLDIPLSTLLANKITIITVKSPDKNPIKGNAKFPINGIDTPKIIYIPTPKDAPEDTPNVYGEAKGFLSIDCITAPLTDSAAPIIKASKTLGNLTTQIIATSLLPTPSIKGIENNLFPITEIMLNILNLELPMEVPIHITKNASGSDNHNNIFLFLFILVWIYSLCHFF